MDIFKALKRVLYVYLGVSTLTTNLKLVVFFFQWSDHSYKLKLISLNAKQE